MRTNGTMFGVQNEVAEVAQPNTSTLTQQHQPINDTARPVKDLTDHVRALFLGPGNRQ